MSKTIITFEKNWRGYAAGETAGFDEKTATALVDSGYAVEVGKKAQKSGKPAQKSTKPPKTSTSESTENLTPNPGENDEDEKP